MKKNNYLVVLILMIFVLSACQLTTPINNTQQPKEVVTPTIETPQITVIVITNTPEATAIVPTETPLPLTTATLEDTSEPVSVASLVDYSAKIYLDDRSTPATLVLSYANAISRHEYVRAYSYWQDATSYLGTLASFTSSLSNVSSEEIALGTIVSEGAAGSVYYSIPTSITDTLSGGGTAKYAACYVLRMPDPGNYGAPPITPMHFFQQTRMAVDPGISDTNVIAAACSNSEGLPAEEPSAEDQSDLSSNNYIDNRSGAQELVQSLLNAINRKEYVRAYSYFENPTTFPGTYSNYEAGFSNTASVTATFGIGAGDAGAGQFYYKIPVAETVTTNSNTTQLFVGCYTLHMSNPAMQATVPFKPLGITSGTFTLYPSGTNVSSLLTTVCK